MRKMLAKWMEMPRKHLVVVASNIVVGNAILWAFIVLTMDGPGRGPTWFTWHLLSLSLSFSVVSAVLVSYALSDSGVQEPSPTSPVLLSLLIAVATPVVSVPVWFVVTGVTRFEPTFLNPFGWVAAEIGLAMIIISKEGAAALGAAFVLNAFLFRWARLRRTTAS